MSWKEIALFFVFVIGAILFLYGANNFDAVTGWSGVFLMLGSFLAEIILKVYEGLRKRKD